MADGLNKVMLLGNLGQDPELKMIAGGQAVLNLRLATTEDVSRQIQHPTGADGLAHGGGLGEARRGQLSKFLTKESADLCRGADRTRSYEKNGEKRYASRHRREQHHPHRAAAGGASRARRVTRVAAVAAAVGSGRQYGGGGGGGSRPPSREPPSPGAGGGHGGGGADPAFEDFASDPGGDDEIPF